MKDICQEYVNKIDKNINSLIFLYGGNQLNFNLNFNQQANSLDKERNIVKILVYKNEDNECICPKCREKIKINTEKLDDIILSINPLTSPGEGVTVFTSPYLSAGAPALGEAKGLINCSIIFWDVGGLYHKKLIFLNTFNIISNIIFILLTLWLLLVQGPLHLNMEM